MANFIDPKLAERVQDLLCEGKSVRRIMVETGVAKGTVQRLRDQLIEAGVDLPNQIEASRAFAKTRHKITSPGDGGVTAMEHLADMERLERGKAMDASEQEERPKYFLSVEIEGEWHVVFRAPENRDQFVSVARFTTKRRAETYAEVEEMFFDENERDPDGAKGWNDDVKAAEAIEPPPPRALADIERELLERQIGTPRPRLPSSADPDARRVELKQRMLAEIAAKGAEGHGGTGPMLNTIRAGYADLCAMLRELVQDGLVVKRGRARGVRYYAREAAPRDDKEPEPAFETVPLRAVNEALALNGKDGDAHEAAVSRKHGARPDDTTAPAEIPPAAPPPVARDHVRASALTLRGKARKQQPRTPVEIVGAYAAPVDLKVNGPPGAPSSIPGQIVLDMLREAGADGEKPSRLRVECGLEPTMFRKMMDALMEAGTVVREKDGTNAEQVRYRLKEFSAQLPLAKGGTAALDGRGHEEGAP